MSKMNNNGESENSELKKEYEAYKTLQDWVKSVPKTMKELEKNGETEKLIKYKKQVITVSDELPYLENENGEFAIPCQIKIAEDCVQQSEYCEDQEEAREWVEDECWIFSGEGYFCVQCNEQVLRNIANLSNKKMI